MTRTHLVTGEPTDAPAPSVYFAAAGSTVWHADCIEAMSLLDAESVDSIVTDPPYGLSELKPAMVVKALEAWISGDRSHVPDARGFMGKAWDAFVPPPAVWDECMRVLKPGGHLLAFAGSRTFDLMGLSIRLAGFEIRDSIAWLYGSGFPKSLDVSKAIDKAAGAEREVVKEGTRGANRPYVSGQSQGKSYRFGGDASTTAPATDAARDWDGWGTALKPAFEPIVVARKPLGGSVAANVLAYGTGALNIDATRVEASGRRKIESVGRTDPGTLYGSGLDGSRAAGVTDEGRWPTNVVLDESQATELDRQSGVSTSRVGKPRSASSGAGWGMTATGSEYDDEGGASRFFPTFRYEAKAPSAERPSIVDEQGNTVQHPTVKPLDLMRYLIRLVTPRGGGRLGAVRG